MLGDFTYNGIPIFNVGFSDFYVFYESIEHDKRVLSKNINRSDLQDYFKKSRINDFGICYEGVILDLRKKSNKGNI
jgi:hypothetical protein